MGYRLIISAILVVPFLLLGCGSNTKKLNDVGDQVVPEPSKLIDVSIREEGMPTSSTTQRNLYLSDIHGQNVIFRLYSDGTAIYSGDDLKTGPPYYTIKVPKDQIAVFFDEMKKHKIFSGKTQLAHSGPSAASVRIYLNDDGQTLWYCSWHEQYADDPNLIVTEDGVFPLEGRNRTEIIESQGEDYKLFLYKWKLIRDSVKKLIENSTRENWSARYL